MRADIDFEKSKEAYRLRKEGKLNEAFKLAKESKDQQTIGWVLYSYTRKALEEKNFQEAAKYIGMLEGLNYEAMKDPAILKSNVDRLRQTFGSPAKARLRELGEQSKEPGQVAQAYEAASELYSKGELQPADHETYGWIIYRFLKSESCKENPNFAKSLFYFYAKALQNPRPSLLHSQMMSVFLSYGKDFPGRFNVIEFAKVWDLSSFREEDFVEHEGDGKKYPSEVSRLGAAVVNLFPPRETLQDIYARLRKKGLTLDVFRLPLYWKTYAATQENNASAAVKYFGWYKKNLCFGECSDGHSRVLKSALFFMKEKNEGLLPSFYFEWRKVPFRVQDMQPRTSQKGEERISLLGETVRHVFKSMKNSKEPQDEGLAALYDDFKNISKFEDDEWFIRDKAILCSMIGRRSEAHRLLLDFLKSHSSQSYAWSDLATYGEMPSASTKTALLCKALSLCGEEKLSVGILVELAASLVEEGLEAQAKQELKRYCAICEKNEFRIKAQAEELLKKLAEVEDSTSNNEDFYQERIQQAEDFIYEDIPWSTFVLVDQYKDKQDRDKYVFADSKAESFSIGTKPLKNLKLSLGNVYRFKRDEQGHVFKAEAANAPKWSALEKRYGIINKIDTEKNIMWLTTPNESVRCSENNKGFSVGDAVEFYYYETEIQGEKKGNAVNISKTSEDNIYKAFYSASAEITRIDEDTGVFFWNAKDSYGRVEVCDRKTLENMKKGDTVCVVYGKYIAKNGKLRANTIHWTLECS